MKLIKKKKLAVRNKRGIGSAQLGPFTNRDVDEVPLVDVAEPDRIVFVINSATEILLLLLMTGSGAFTARLLLSTLSLLALIIITKQKTKAVFLYHLKMYHSSLLDYKWVASLGILSPYNRCHTCEQFLL